jgi:hypothetical protein
MFISDRRQKLQRSETIFASANHSQPLNVWARGNANLVALALARLLGAHGYICTDVARVNV